MVIARGRLVRQGTLASLEAGPAAVLVRTPTPELLADALAPYAVTTVGDRLRVEGCTTDEVGHLAHLRGVELHELAAEASDLEKVFLDLTRDGGGGMTTALVRSELRKITSTRLWWGLLVGAVVYTVIQAAANAALAGSDPGAGQPATAALDTAEAIRTIYASSPFQGSYIFAMILGITGMTGEYRYQTITPTFLATPRRDPGRARQDGGAPGGRRRLRRRLRAVRAAGRRGGHRDPRTTRSGTAPTGSGPRSCWPCSRSGSGRCSASGSAR